VTTFEPGAIEVFTHGFELSPRLRALRASRPAAIITEGFEVFVHEVIDAIATAALASSKLRPSAVVTSTDLPSSPGAAWVWMGLANWVFALESSMRSCGGFGPEIEGTTVERSSSRYSEYSTSLLGSCHSPWALAYSSTSWICSSERPVSLR